MSEKEGYVKIPIPNDIYEELAEKAKNLGFKTVDDYCLSLLKDLKEARETKEAETE